MNTGNKLLYNLTVFTPSEITDTFGILFLTGFIRGYEVFSSAVTKTMAGKFAEALAGADILVSPPGTHLLLYDQQLKGSGLPEIIGVNEYVQR